MKGFSRTTVIVSTGFALVGGMIGATAGLFTGIVLTTRPKVR